MCDTLNGTINYYILFKNINQKYNWSRKQTMTSKRRAQRKHHSKKPTSQSHPTGSENRSKTICEEPQEEETAK
jgi:hypothetical protein